MPATVVAGAGKTAYTYYEAISSIDQSEQQQQIELCRQSWQRHGWELVVLGLQQAQQHPWFELYSLGMQSLPTVNSHEYEYHCFLRWLAMVTAGGGLMIDYDVMNMGITDLAYFQQHQPLTIYQRHVPCVVYGTAEQYLAVCKKFFQFAVNRLYIELYKGRPHVSDMLMLQSGFTDDDVKKLQLVKNYPETCPLVHCSTNSMKANGGSKVQAMQKLLSQLDTSTST